MDIEKLEKWAHAMGLIVLFLMYRGGVSVYVTFAVIATAVVVTTTYFVNFNVNYLCRVAEFHRLSYAEAKSYFEKDPQTFERMFVLPYRIAGIQWKEERSMLTGKSGPGEVARIRALMEQAEAEGDK
jgi:hypothetical protein